MKAVRLIVDPARFTGENTDLSIVLQTDVTNITGIAVLADKIAQALGIHDVALKGPHAREIMDRLEGRGFLLTEWLK